MKKITVFILIMILISNIGIGFSFDELDNFVPEIRPINASENVANEILAMDNGYEMILNSNFNDIGNDIYEKEILKLSAEGVIKEYGKNSFRPDDKITGYEAIAMLVRFIGNEEQVNQIVLNNSRGLDSSTVENIYNEEYLNQAQNQGIILNNEMIYLNRALPKEILARWIFRVSNFNEDFADLSETYSFNDINQLDPSDNGLVKTLLKEEIMEVNKSNNFNPKKELSRSEAVKIIDNLSNAMQEQRNIESVYGMVIDIVDSSDEDVKIKDFYVKDSNGEVTKITTSFDKDTNSQNNFIAYKNNKLISSSEIRKGDELNYFTRNNQVYFAEVINDKSIVDKIEKLDESNENSKILLAEVKEISDENHNNGNGNINRRRVRILAIDGNTYDLIVDTDLNTNTKKDFLVYKNATVVGGKNLSLGDNLIILVKDNDTASYIKVYKPQKKWIKGTIRSVNEDSIEVFDYNNKINEYPLLNYYGIEINERPTNVDDLEYGQDVELELTNGFITSIKAETFINPGYIPEYGKIRMGEVYQKFNSGMIFLLNNGEQEFYNVDNETILLKQGESILPKALKEGDKVKLFFSDIYTTTVDKIEVEGNERLIKQVYKGTIRSFNQGNMRLTLSNPEYLKNVKWIKSDSYIQDIPVDDKVKIYNKDQVVDKRDFIKRFKDKEAYVVVENSYGNENAIKISIKDGGELVMNDKIDHIDRALSSFELDNNQNVNYNKGTIIIKDGRVISNNILNRDDSVLVVSERNQGINNANLVKVTSMQDNMFDNVYFGTLKDVNFNSITLDNHSNIEDNEIDDINTSETDEFYCFTETKITDVSDPDNIEILDINDLFHGSYSERENKSTDHDGVDYEKYYTYLVTDGNSGVISMKIRFKGLLDKQNFDDNNSSVRRANDDFEDTLNDVVFTKGLLTEKIDGEDRFKITDTHDYIPYRNKWVLNTTDTYFEHDDAIIINNNEEITAENVEIGQYLYIMRIDEKGLIIFVEDE